MNQKETLTKAIEKAVANGWYPFDKSGYTVGKIEVKGDGKNPFRIWIQSAEKSPRTITGEDYHDVIDISVESLLEHHTYVIFSHGFAKALWGEGVLRVMTTKGTHDYAYSDFPEGGVVKYDGEIIATSVHKQGWKEHLQQMVIADDPIRYLAENI